MKTVPENDSGLDRHYKIQSDTNDDFDHLERCRTYEPHGFYDYGAPSIVGFSGFVSTGDSAFIAEVEKCFD